MELRIVHNNNPAYKALDEALAESQPSRRVNLNYNEIVSKLNDSKVGTLLIIEGIKANRSKGIETALSQRNLDRDIDYSLGFEEIKDDGAPPTSRMILKKLSTEAGELLEVGKRGRKAPEPKGSGPTEGTGKPQKTKA